jgi:membrane protease YdiL (CAAX protease family)
MTLRPIATGARVVRGPMTGAVLITLGVAVATAVRWTLVRMHTLPGIDGVAFAACLVGVTVLVAAMDAQEPTREQAGLHRSTSAWPAVWAVCFGVVGALVLTLVPLLVRLPGADAVQLAPRPDATFSTWAIVTILVATSEEACFRGVLFESLLRDRGVLVTVAWTSLAFALIHVPFYGWGALPIDLAAGVWFAGLKLTTGRVAAPAVAHALADLVTWWL